MQDHTQSIDAGASLLGVIRQAQATGDPVIVTEKGVTAGVVLSGNAYEELLDRLELAEIVRAIATSREDSKMGRIHEARQSTIELAQRYGIDLA